MIWLYLMLAASLVSAQQTLTFPFGQTAEPPEPSAQEQADLQKAVTEAQTSAIDLLRSLEGFLDKYPKTTHRAELEAALAKAAADVKDQPRTVKYGERYLERVPDDVVMLDRVSSAMLNVGGEENAQKALKYARVFEDMIDSMGQAEGKDATARQEERDRARNRTILYQARARSILGDKDEAARQAARAFDIYPNEQSARERAEALIAAGREKDAIVPLAEAFAIPDSHATDQDRQGDRLLLGQIYAKVHGSTQGLGDLVLEAYDRTSSLVDARRKRLLALDPNATLADAMDYTITRLDGQKVLLSTLKGKIVIMDFWATWCAPCRVQHPLYEEVKKNFAQRDDVVFLALSTDEEKALVAPFVEAQQWDKGVYFDDGLARLMQVTSIPTTVIIDKQGKIASRMNGFLAESFVPTLTGRIGELLKP